MFCDSEGRPSPTGDFQLIDGEPVTAFDQQGQGASASWL